MMMSAITERLWALLRTSGGKTLKLADSLAEHEFDAWTPRATTLYRLPRRRDHIDRHSPILPTFVFIRAAHLPDISRVLAQPINPHPSFSVFRYFGRTPLVSDAHITTLRAAEQAAMAAYARHKAAVDAAKSKTEEQERIRILRAEAPSFAIGDRVTLQHGAFTGLTATVQDDGREGRDLVINFGANWTMKVEAWQLESGEVERSSNILTGAAA